MVAAVVFDLDYTLAVPERDRAAILREAVERAGGDPPGREAYLRAHHDHVAGETGGIETREPIFAAITDEGNPAVAAREYRRGLAETLRPVEGAERLLDTLAGEYRLGLLTNGPTRSQRDKLETLGWIDRFDAVAIAGELGVGKPDPRAFEAVVDRLGVAPEQAAYVGDDTEADVVGAAEAGLVAVQVLFPDGPAPEPVADAHVERSRLAERLPDVLD